MQIEGRDTCIENTYINDEEDYSSQTEILAA